MLVDVDTVSGTESLITSYRTTSRLNSLTPGSISDIYKKRLVPTTCSQSTSSEKSSREKMTRARESTPSSYVQVVMERNLSEKITLIVYPNDNMFVVNKLRWKQQHFLVAATVQDSIRHFNHSKYRCHVDFAAFPEKVAIQRRDTHPSIGIPEQTSLLVDVEGIEWYSALNICQRL